MTEAEIQCVERIVEKEARRVINVVIEHVATLLEQELGDRHEIAARSQKSAVAQDKGSISQWSVNRARSLSGVPGATISETCPTNGIVPAAAVPIGEIA